MTGDNTSQDIGALGRKLDALQALTNRDRMLLANLSRHGRPVAKHTKLVLEGDSIPSPLVILAGWACQERILANGSRQIISVLIPGDLVGLTAFQRHGRAMCSVHMLTGGEVTEESAVHAALTDRTNGLQLAFQAVEALERTCLFDHIVRLGRQSAYEKMADFVLEMRARLKLIQDDRGETYDMPLTQMALADLLGLSNVHVSRTLQTMRRDGILEFRDGVLKFRDVDRLLRDTRYRSPVDRSRHDAPAEQADVGHDG